jgi:Domain of unknown function (DUF4276)
VTELVFMLEEPSARAMLEGLLPRIGLNLPTVRYVVFEGKQDLEKQVAKRIRGYRNPNARFIVIRDQDSNNDCGKLKAKLFGLCADAVGNRALLARVFCRELEAIYIGDLSAVEAALKITGISKRQNERRFRTPDTLMTPSNELKKLTGGAYQKISGSRAIGLQLDVDNTRSNSFKVLVSGIRQICG